MRTESVLAILLLSSGAGTAHEGTPSQYNYRDDIRPIFVKHCGGCHFKGGVGPMSLLQYQEAVPWANAIKMQVLGEHMPPWLPVDGIGAFKHARTLSAEEIDMVVDWVVGQTPEGEPLTASELEREEEAAWDMGEPDLVLRPDAEIVIDEVDYELTACVVLPTGLSEARTATEFEVRPVLATVLRRATITLGTSCDEGRPLATWLPGQGSVALAQTLPKEATLAVELLYVKGWEDEGMRLTDWSEIGIRFSNEAPVVQSEYVTGSTHAFDRAVELLALYPLPTAKEEPLRIEAATPDGTVQPLLVIERYEAQWREKYILLAPLPLPAGSELRLSQPAVWIDFISAETSRAE